MFHMISPIIIKDSYSLDKLVYGTERGEIVIRSLPFLDQVRRHQVSGDSPVLSIISSPDRRFLLVGCGDGGMVVITDPINCQVTENNPNFKMNFEAVWLSISLINFNTNI